MPMPYNGYISPQKPNQKEVNELKNAPRFPQGKAVADYLIPSSKLYTTSPESEAKLAWGTEQIYQALRLEAGNSWEINITNFDANPATMKHWLNRACSAMFPSGNRHLTFKYRGSRRKGTLFVKVLHGRKPTVGKKGVMV